MPRHTKCKVCGKVYEPGLQVANLKGEGKIRADCLKCGKQSEYTTKDFYVD